MSELEKPSIVYELRHYYCQKQRLTSSGHMLKEFIEEDVGTTVDYRRHSTVVHVAKTISIRNLREKVVERCPQTHLSSQMSGSVFSFLQHALHHT